MEQEYFFTGYCRNADESRMVTVVTENGQITEVDCCYENCIYAPGCPIGKQILELAESQNR
jgi:hypothetical protein